MRISLLQGFNQSVENILRVQEQTFKTQNQISTGRKILTPADDPVASAQLIQLNQEQAQTGQFLANISVAENRLSSEEVRLSSVNELLVRARELIISAGNLASNNLTSRKAIGAELNSRLDELVDLANAQDANGEYIFAGFLGDVQPFVENADGTYSYRGDDGQRQVNISGGTQVPISDSGRAIFEDITAAQNGVFTTASNANTGSAIISSGAIIDQTIYDSVYPEDFRITFSFPAGTFDITRESDGSLVFGGLSYSSGSPITIFGSEVTISDSPSPPADGDSFVINSTGKQSIMTTFAKAVAGLDTLTDDPADIVILRQLIDDTLTNITNAEESVATVWSQVGARLNTLDGVRSLQESIDLVNTEIISELRDLDYAEALSRLSIETFTLEAAQQSFTRVSNLSLFNFLR